jgi:hypothetical protein
VQNLSLANEHFDKNRANCENFPDIADIETDEAETWHTPRFELAEPENIN